jgi:BolA protein
MQEQIKARLAAFPWTILEVQNESHMHSRGAETHFKVTGVSELFEGKTRLERSRWLHTVLAEEIGRIHSLTSRLLTPQEWSKNSESVNFQSPRCQGAHDKN